MFYLAFSLGLMSSLHCVGMCGPIALALPVHQRSKWGKLGGILLYNLGRATTYALLGFLLGFVGNALNLAGLQRSLSIGTGIIMLAAVAYSSHWLDQLGTPSFLQKSVQWLKKQLGTLLHQRSFSSLFMLGTLNGLLPCGLVYMALISSIATGGPTDGALFMATFGLGTLPAMSAVAFVKNLFSNFLRSRARQWMPAFVAVVAIVLILRGLEVTGWPILGLENREIPVCHGGR
ncbi:sulfite exporter TauE/SafE family protein [Runella sp. SP2]|uniref:sulfite exporter TauE/SafE family protein n=1 Tax=Runella sp. SP2 TaxID=2268026 RepID=UPI000F07A866|nr:sulfite exporter TauE/SafE family protein [Runella sp. SP2]AYQ33644.1 sulfite exporter TauE/SafE family protein [Runella sp. SP2]